MIAFDYALASVVKTPRSFNAKIMHELRTIYPLLVAHILFVNFGDALHRASCFEFHHAAECCQCSHSTVLKSRTAKREPNVTEAENEAGDCPLCRFFDLYSGANFAANYSIENSAVEIGQTIYVLNHRSIWQFYQSGGPHSCARRYAINPKFCSHETPDHG